jgi:hypothetical protein
MIRSWPRVVAGLLIGTVCCSTFLDPASACLFRRRCCARYYGQQYRQPSTPPKGPEEPPPPNELPKISEVPPETPKLVIPDAVKQLATANAGGEKSDATAGAVR